MDYRQEFKKRVKALEDRKKAEWNVNDIEKLAKNEAKETFIGQKQRNTHADAYRHILVSAEIARRNGAGEAFKAGYGHEFLNLLEDAPWGEVAMDTHNNRIGRDIGTRAESWDDVVRMAREMIDTSALNGNGNGENGTAKWSKKVPIQQWPKGWKNKPPLTYQKGGSDHRHKTKPLYGPSAASHKTWTEAQMLKVQKKVLTLPSGHPDRDRLDAQVRRWYAHNYGDGPAQFDATGRMISPRPIQPIPGGGGSVNVGAYDRSQEGHSVNVRGHTRARPS